MDTNDLYSTGKIARKYLEIGKTNAEFTIDLPRLPHSSPTAITAWRATDPAGKAIVYMWDDIHVNLAPLKDLGLRSHLYQEILDDPTKKRRSLNKMIEGRYLSEDGHEQF